MINKALLIEQLKRFWIVSLIGGLVLFVLMPLQIFIAVNNENPNLVMLVRHFFFLNDFLIMGLLLALPSVVFPIMASFFDKNEMTAFYAFPVKKQTIHLTNALAGIILTVLPILVICLILLIPIQYSEPPYMWFWSEIEGYRTFAEVHFAGPLFPGDVVVEGGTINTLSAVAILFTRMIIIALFNFAVFWLASSLSGNIIISLLISGALMSLAVILPLFTNEMVAMYVYGAPALGAVFPERATMMVIPGIYWLTNIPNALQTGGDLFAIILAHSLVTIFLGTLAYFVSSLRKAENTGNSIVFNPVKNIIIFIISFGVGFIAAMLFWGMGRSPVSFYLGFLSGFIIGYFISQMIAEQSFSILHKAKYLAHFTGVLIVLYGAFFLFTQFGMGFYVNRVPAEERIVGVYVSQHWSNIDWRWGHDLETWFVTNREVISMTLEAHKNVIADRANQRESPWNLHNTFRRFIGIYGYSRFSVDYLLDNGRVIQRSYVLPNNFFASASLAQLFMHRDVILLEREILMHPEGIDSIHFSYFTEVIEHGIVIDFIWHDDVVFRSYDSINLILEMLQDYVIERERDRINHIFIEGRSPRVEYGPISVGIIIDRDWVNRELSRVRGFTTSLQVSREFFEEVLAVTDGLYE